jgi:hypothetical protein
MLFVRNTWDRKVQSIVNEEVLMTYTYLWSRHRLSPMKWKNIDECAPKMS